MSEDTEAPAPGRGVGGAAVVLLAALGLWWLWPALPEARSQNPLRAGQRRAERLGCFSCHGPPGAELGNEGAPSGRVPSLIRTGSEQKDWSEIEQWIRDGHPRALREDPERWDRHLQRVLHMPAFGAQLSQRELEELVAWALVAGGHVGPEDETLRYGERLARRNCLPCHGVGASGGTANPGSLTGYVPALFGVDLHDLARDEAEIREWIQTGGTARLASIPGVSRWWRRQVIRMPAFGGRLSDAEIDALVAYIGWLDETEGGYLAARRLQ